MNKRTLIGASIVAGVALLIYFNFFYKSTFEFAGTVEATKIDLPSRISTTVKTIKFDEGDIVKKDQLLIELSCEDIEIANKLASDNFARAVQLKKTGSISKEVFDSSKNKKDESDLKLNWCQIRSPTDGTILTKYIEPSEWVNPGSRLLTIADLKTVWTYFYVPQTSIPFLRVGTRVNLKSNENGKTYSGSIIKINEEAEFTPKNVQTQSERTRLIFGVKVRLENEAGELKPGMTLVTDLNLKD
jgi:HlyD family secretion protein